ncbi:hypothetical protein GCM10010112_69760 [Actinoplanes lobatus]|uniref:LIM zinc-binding domain-containing protein n=1 Tax=Actinoplanes lobatus TaxID=113568 RepID=A0A7W7MJV2_9ACTN|nr:protein DA1 [Actinoplanes lobatus]MBB4753047.1 hypothetical protein [Actinoplanes lobatus]GGN87289.1 hypothetical protein GCM10010112_69760 [Actinoplanes lobatus]GIE39654.1 hypothetical protein Alo02nite_25520 [Actinoplanes lobatus]
MDPNRICAAKDCGQEATKAITPQSGPAIPLCVTHSGQQVRCQGCQRCIEVVGVQVRPHQRYTYSGHKVCTDCQRSSTLSCRACLTPVGKPGADGLFPATATWRGGTGLAVGYRCAYCDSADIPTLEEAKPLIDEAVLWFGTWLGGLNFTWPDLTGRIIYDVVTDDVLATRGNDSGNVQGLTLTKQVGKQPKQYEVLVIVGVRRITFMEVLLHELAHVWTNDKDYNDSPYVEGFCNLVAYKYLEDLNRNGQTPEIRAEAGERIVLLKTDASPIYGGNFNAFRQMAENSPNIVGRYLETVKPKK